MYTSLFKLGIASAVQYTADKGYNCVTSNLYARYIAFQTPIMELYVCDVLMDLSIEFSYILIVHILHDLKDRAHLSTFKFVIFEKFSCFIVLVVFLVVVQSSELISVWFCEKMTFKKKIISYHIFAIYVGGASLGVPTACRLIAVSGARLPSADGLAVRCIKNAPPC